METMKHEENIQILSNYFKDIEPIGVGGYAKVYQGVEELSKEILALKLLPLNTRKEKIFYKQEVKVLNYLPAHPNICHLRLSLKISKYGKRYGILVFNKLQMDLLQFIGKFTIRELLFKRIFYLICKAVKHCHENKIAHLDLKPENILIDIDPPSRITKVQLCDFGFARKWKADQRTGSPLLSKIGKRAIGTVEYRAPEINSNNKRISLEKADIWSLGVILFSCLSGYFPYLFQDEIIVSEIDLSSIKEFTKDDRCYRLLKKMLDRDYTRRPTIQQVLKDPWFSTLF